MKKYIRHIAAICLFIMLFSLTGCKKPAEKDPTNGEEKPAVTETSDDSGDTLQGKPQEKDPTEESESKAPQTEAPLPAISGIDNKPESISSSITRVEQISYQASFADLYFHLLNRYVLKGQQIIRFELTEDDPANRTSAYEDKQHEQYLAIWDEAGQSFSTMVQMEPYQGQYGYIEVQVTDNYIWTITHSEGVTEDVYRCFDQNLNYIKSFSTNTSFGLFSADDEWYIYKGDHGLEYIRTDGSSQTLQIRFDQTFYPLNTVASVKDKDGNKLTVLKGLFSDMKEHMVVTNLENREVLSVFEADGDDSLYWSQSGDCLMACDYKGGRTIYYYIYGDKAYKCSYPSSSSFECETIGKYVIFKKNVRKDGKAMPRVMVFDMEKGCYVADEILDIDGNDNYLAKEYILSDKPEIYLQVSRFTNNSDDLYRLELGDAEIDTEKLPTVESYTPELVDPAKIERIRNIEDYLPGECAPDLMECRKIADELEERFGVKIYLSYEAQMIVTNYAISAFNDKDSLMLLLKDLEKQLSKYPEGFFRQMTWNSIDHIGIYLGGDIVGYGYNSLGLAGGFQCEGQTEDIIFISCSYATEIPSLNHEISHAIDRKLGSLYGKPGYLEESDWAALNPSDFEYLNSYSDWENSGMNDEFKYTASSEKNADVYFVDSYAKTYPTEDRARVFEYAMNDDEWFKIEEYPHLLDKLELFSKMIRAGFDTEGWDDVLYWEKKISDRLSFESV